MKTKKFALKDLAPGCVCYLLPYGTKVVFNGVASPQCGPCPMILKGLRQDGTEELFNLADIYKIAAV